MNYYINGDAAKADQIKAVFEVNGIDTSANSNYGISNLFYFSCNGEVAVTQNRSIINIIKTHPDYKELELPVEPKFKVGDRIRWINHDVQEQTITDIKDGSYITVIATTIKQSRRLLELGLDSKTADCNWNTTFGDWSLCVGENKLPHAVPAWSLSALLEVMPKVIVHDMDEHVLCFKYAEGVAPFMYYVVESGRNKGKLIRFDNGRCVPDAYDALDAAYKMVCWLLEQGLIKKGGEE